MPRKRVQSKQSSRRRPGRNDKLKWIGGVGLLAVVMALVLIFANPQAAPVGDFVTVEKGNWPQAEGKSLGPADAKVVIQEFSDFQCPFCRQFSTLVGQRLIDEYVATGKVRFEYKHYIVIDDNVGGSESRQSAKASECAAEQGAFWDYHEILFANQKGEGGGAFSNDRLRAFAESLGLDMPAFNSCFNSARAANAVTADEAQARTLGVRGTPGVLINGQFVNNPLDYAALKTLIDAALGAN